MKSNKLPTKLKEEISKSINEIKFLLQDDKEYADELILKLSKLSNEEISSEHIRDYLVERYDNIIDLNDQTYQDFIGLKSKVNNLIYLINFEDENTKKSILEQYISNGYKDSSDFPLYLQEAQNEICASIESYYAQITGTTNELTAVEDYEI